MSKRSPTNEPEAGRQPATNLAAQEPAGSSGLSGQSLVEIPAEPPGVWIPCEPKAVGTRGVAFAILLLLFTSVINSTGDVVDIVGHTLCFTSALFFFASSFGHLFGGRKCWIYQGLPSLCKPQKRGQALTSGHTSRVNLNLT